MRAYHWGLLAVGVVALLLASFVEYQHDVSPVESWVRSSKTYVGVLKELGFAFFIAFIIVFTVEEHQRRRQAEDFLEEAEKIKRNVFEAVYEVRQPKEVRDIVTEKILRGNFFRENSSAFYEIEPKQFKKHDGTTVPGVTIRAHCSFDVRNVGATSETYRLQMFVEKPTIRGLENPLEDVSIDSLVIDGVEQDEDGVRQADAQVEDDESKKIIKCVDIESGKSVHINFSFSMVRGYDDSELWITKVPNNGMKWAAKFPKELKTFGVFLLHQSKPVQTHKSADTGYYVWELRDTVLPNQGLLLWWRFTDCPEFGFNWPAGGNS